MEFLSDIHKNFDPGISSEDTKKEPVSSPLTIYIHDGGNQIPKAEAEPEPQAQPSGEELQRKLMEDMQAEVLRLKEALEKEIQTRKKESEILAAVENEKQELVQKTSSLSMENKQLLEKVDTLSAVMPHPLTPRNPEINVEEPPTPSISSITSQPSPGVPQGAISPPPQMAPSPGGPMFTPQPYYMMNPMDPNAGGQMYDSRGQFETMNLDALLTMDPSFNGGDISAADLVTLAKTFYGSRFIQNRIEIEASVPSYDTEARPFFSLFFNQIKGRCYELMTNKFGRFAFEKLLMHCRDQERMTILKNLVPNFAAVACDTHGSFGTQVLVRALHTPEQLDLLVLAIEPHILKLATDYKGHYLIIVLVSQFSHSLFKFIDETILANFVTVCTNNQGLQVMKAIFKSRSAEQLTPVMEAIVANVADIVEDQYGNYVVQQSLSCPSLPITEEPGSPADLAQNSSPTARPVLVRNKQLKQALLGKLMGRIRDLSQMKFASNVVEFCLKTLQSPFWTNAIIMELLGKPAVRVKDLINDRFGNYVLQTGLLVANKEQVDKITDAISVHLPSFRSSLRTKWIKLITLSRERVNAPANLISENAPMMMYSGDQSPTVMFSNDSQSPGSNREQLSMDHPYSFNFASQASPKTFPQSPVMGAPVPALTMSPLHSPMQHHLYMQSVGLGSPHYVAQSPVHGGGAMSQSQMLPPMQLQPGQFYQPAYSGYGHPLNYRAKPFTLNRNPGQ